MLTSHCLACGAPKAQSEWGADYCGSCAALRAETREYVTRENAERNKHNASVLTDDVKARIEKAAEADVTGSAARELTHSLGLKPLIDMSAALRDAMARRLHHTNSGHADPRAVFNPGITDARASDLGMGAKVPPGRTLTPTPPGVS